MYFSCPQIFLHKGKIAKSNTCENLRLPITEEIHRHRISTRLAGLQRMHTVMHNSIHMAEVTSNLIR